MSASIPPDPAITSPSGARHSALTRWGARNWESGLAAAYLATHLPTLAPALEDIDSINFALGLRDFNPAEHQPHPPGYPVYIAVGRLMLAAVHAVSPGMEQVAAEAAALSLISVLSGGAAVVFGARLFGRLAAGAEAESARVRVWAVLLLIVCPLFWLTGLRPMSDMPGLAIALAAQVLLADGRLRAGAFVSGLALGVRSQTLWLTAPLAALMLLRLGARGWREAASAVALAAAGAVVWAVPLVAASGGIDGYLAALRTQAGEDFAYVDMLWNNPTPRRLAFGLLHTFVLPWGSTALAAVMLALAGAGGVVLWLRDRPALAVITAAFAPYAVFHLVFQETVTVRYALPLVAPVAFLAARAVASAGRVAALVGAPVAVAALVTAVPAGIQYSADAHPAFRAVADLARRAAGAAPAFTTSHFELSRPLRAADTASLTVVYAPRQREWMELVKYWRSGDRRPVWFLANPRRTDLALIDPQSRRDVARYRWAAESHPALSGTRPIAVDWYRLQPPGWFLGEGWSLTPEAGGVAQASRRGPHHGAIAAYVRPRRGPAHVVVGGRHLGGRDDGPAALEMTLGDAVIDRWTASFAEPNFLRFVELAGGVPGPPEEYVALTIVARPAAAGRAPGPVAIRQFDVQSSEDVIVGFGEGWHEPEYDPESGVQWRWSSERALLRVRGPVQPLRIRLRAESPLRYFEAPPTISLAAGGRIIAQLRPAAAVDWNVVVPADALAAGGGDIVLETTRTFVPAETEGSSDARRLGLRVFGVEVQPAR